MGFEVIASLVAGIVTMLVGGLAASDQVRRIILGLAGHHEPEKTYGERLAELSSQLTKASREVDAVLNELAQVARNRATAVEKLEVDLATLEGREQELKQKIDALEKTPLPVAEHFAHLVESGEKRSARRDYMLFGAGVVVTTVIAIVIQLFAR